MLKFFVGPVLIVAGLIVTSGPATALQLNVTQLDSNKDGTTTYHFSVKTDTDETLVPGASKTGGDFITIYNFYGLVDGSVKSPTGWAFSSEEFGRTPMLNGYPAVLPVDVPNTPNLTWAVTKPVTAGTQIGGFTATTKVNTVVHGEYTAQVTRQSPALKAAASATPGEGAMASKQAIIGALAAPSFLAEVK